MPVACRSASRRQSLFFLAENLYFRPTRTMGTTRRHLREDRWIPDSIRLFALPCAVEKWTQSPSQWIHAPGVVWPLTLLVPSHTPESRDHEVIVSTLPYNPFSRLLQCSQAQFTLATETGTIRGWVTDVAVCCFKEWLTCEISFSITTVLDRWTSVDDLRVSPPFGTRSWNWLHIWNPHNNTLLTLPTISHRYKNSPFYSCLMV